MRPSAPVVAVACLVLAPCAHAPAPLGLSITVRPPGRVRSLEGNPTPARRALATLASLPAEVTSRFVPGAAEVVSVDHERPADSSLDLGTRMPARPLPLPEVAAGSSAAFQFDGDRRGWVAKLEGQALPSPVYADGKVMVGGGFASHTFYGLDAVTGRFVWTTAASDGGPTAGLAIEDKVLFNTESCTLFCIDPKTGHVLWKRWLGDPVMGQPAAAHGVVYSGHIVDGGGGYALSALRLADGSVIWRQRIDADVLSAPVVIGQGWSASVYVTTMRGTVYCLRARDGSERWHASADATSAPWIDGTSVLLSRRRPGDREQPIVLSAHDGRLLAVGREAHAPYANRRPDAGGVQAGWSFEGSRPVLANGRAYYAMGAELRARDLRTGEEVWRRRAPTAGAVRGMTPPAVVGGSLVVGTRAGELFGIDVDTGMTTFALRVGEPIATPPVVAKGWVYCTTTAGKLVGLEIGDPGLDGWHMWGGSASHTGPLPAALDDPARADRTPSSVGTLRIAPNGQPVVVAPRSTRIEAQVSGFVARLEIDQVFANPSDQALDAAYLLPLPPDAAVDAMRMTVGNRTIEARIDRRQAARATFAAAQAAGRTASLLEQERPDRFQQRVANIPPRAEVRVRVQLVSVLRVTDGAFRLAIPLQAAPRYRPEGAPPEPAARTRSGDGLSLRVAIDAGVPITSATSLSHEVRTERLDANRQVLTLVPRREQPNHDFVVAYRTAGATPQAGLLATRTGEHGAFALLVHPPARVGSHAIAPRELVVVVDASSSMAGRASAMARDVTTTILEGLGPRDTARVVAFSDRSRAMSDEASPAGGDLARRARAFLDSIHAQGGTEIAPALARALAEPPPARRLRTIVLLSDGNVGNDDEVLRLIATSLGDARLHTVALGASPNRWLLERAAEIGRGTSAVVGLSEDATHAADELARRLAGPLVTDLAIDWGGLAVRDVYPRIVPDLHAGEPLVILGRTGGPGRGTVRLRGRMGGRPWSTELPVELPALDERHAALGTAWARRRVHELEAARLLGPSTALAEQIAAVGLEHRLVTSQTSLIAVAPEPVATSAAPAALVGSQTFGSFSSSYWTDELGMYRAAASPAVGGSGITYEFSDDTIDGELARPEGEALAMSLRQSDDDDGPFGARLELRPGPQPRSVRSAARVQAAFASARLQLEGAYRAALESNAELRGRLVVEVTIRRDGSVAVARFVTATVRDAGLQAAILRVVRSLSFGPGAAETVTFPIDLAPSAAR